MSLFSELKKRNVFRVCAAYLVSSWVIVQVADFVLDNIDAPAWVMQTILLVLGIGLLIALVVSWAYELTPQGLMKEKDVVRPNVTKSETAQKLDYITLAATLIVVGLFVFQFFIKPGSPQSINAPETAATPSDGIVEIVDDKKSIAVLPFVNRSPAEDDAFFAAGIHDDLLTHLSKIADMRVISRTSVMQYADTEETIPAIAMKLGVATIMEGAVQRAGKRVRINVQLIDATSDEHLWAEIYDRELTADNVFEIQSEITRAIAAALKSTLSEENETDLQSKPTQSLAAYDAYIKATAITRQLNLTNEQKETAADLFDTAISEDPNFAAAYAGQTQLLMEEFWRNGRTDQGLVKKAKKTLTKAQNLAPDSIEVLNAEGYYYYWGFLDYERAAESIDKSLTKAPNEAEVWKLKSFVARRQGRFEESLRAIYRAIELDPLSVDSYGAALENLSMLGRKKEGVKLLDHAKEVVSDSLGLAQATLQFWSAFGDSNRVCDISTKDLVGSTVDWIKFNCAWLNRDLETLQLALKQIPGNELNTPDYPFTKELIEARALEWGGKISAAQEQYKAVALKLNALPNPFPGGWSVHAGYYPDMLPGFMRDRAGVEAAVANFEMNAEPDAYGNIDRRTNIVASLARVGAFDKAFEYLEKNIELIGFGWYPRLAIDPYFDDLAAHPRFKAMRADYEQWQAEIEKNFDE